tara:strand:+ start:8885 stop:9064 length:180 start_codon:yes stop_codon:yes gene_type:complete
MGWKITIDITREEAKELIIKRIIDLETFSDKELANVVEELGYGDNPDLIYYGRNFMVTD